MTGRPRDPKRAKRRTGHRRKPDEAPALAVVDALPAPTRSGGLEPPDGLPAEMVPIWEATVEAIGSVTTLRPADSMVVEAFVRQYARMREAGALVDEHGILARQASSGNVIATPFLRAERDAATLVLRFAEHYGLTVASRLRLGLMQLAGQTLAQALNEDLDG